MELILQPESSDFQHQLIFRRPILNILQGPNRLTFINNLVDLFSIRAADFSFQNNLSSNDIAFKKVYGHSRLEVTLGADESKASLTNPENIDQVKDLLGKFYNLFKSEECVQKINLQRRLSADVNVDDYFKELCSCIPKSIKKNIKPTGIISEVTFDDVGLAIKFVIEKAVGPINGIFQYFDFFFSDQKKDFEILFKLLYEKYDLLNKEFGLIIEDK